MIIERIARERVRLAAVRPHQPQLAARGPLIVNLQGAPEVLRYRFDRAFLEILVERLNMANLRLATV